MAGKTTPVVFITANVGSIFEEPSVMLKIWTQEFLSTIARLDPKFVALHCQEVGGKNYEKSMEHVEDFVQLLINSDELRLFDKVRIYLDEDYSSAENFTALGSFYFIHESITDVLIYDFESRNFVDVTGKEIYSKNIEHVTTKEKSKFPLQYFPECKWSRKGFLRTRWNLNGTIFDLVNIHLFHDASNFVAMESFPSVYSDTRRRALAYTLDRFQTDEHGPAPLFLFGDFNFRTDTQGVVKRLSEGLNSSTVEGEVSIIQFKQQDKIILSLGKKEFSHSDHQTIFTAKDGDWLREFDKELDSFSDQLFEFRISFPPSYPFEENSTGDRCYMKTRCPAWCDRVVLSHSAIPLVKDFTNGESIEYGLMGRSACMGDHKPVYLKVEVKGDTAKEKIPESTEPGEVPIQDTSTKQVTIQDPVKLNNSPDKLSPNMKHPGVEADKLTCSLEALIIRNGLPNQPEPAVEPNFSQCSTCRSQQQINRLNHPGGEEGIMEESRVLTALSSGIKAPEGILNKTEVIDTGQKVKGHDVTDRFGAVKRVNSASLVENKPKKEDWKNSRCNSDVSWSPGKCGQVQDVTKMWKMNKTFNRGSSRIRLISSSNSLNASLPRLTSHHSSSDEEWFEEVAEGDDDVMKMAEEEEVVEEKTGEELKCENTVTNSTNHKENENHPNIKKSCENLVKSASSIKKKSKFLFRPKSGFFDKESKTFSIFKRLTEGRKESQNVMPSCNKKFIKGSFENLIVEPSFEPGSTAKGEKDAVLTNCGAQPDGSNQLPKLNTQHFIGDNRKSEVEMIVKENIDSWETIELGDGKQKENDKPISEMVTKEKENENKCCCSIQ